MPAVSEKLREIATKRISDALSISKNFFKTTDDSQQQQGGSSSSSSVGNTSARRPLEDYVKRLEAAMFSKYGVDADDYKDQTTNIIRSLKPPPPSLNVADGNDDDGIVPFVEDVHNVEPEVLAIMPAEDMVSKVTYAHRIEEQERREKEHEILPENDLSSTAVLGGGALTCPVCGKVKLSNINMNLCGVEDKTFENNFQDNRCECTEKEIEQKERDIVESEKKNKGTTTSSSSSSAATVPLPPPSSLSGGGGAETSGGGGGEDGFLMPGLPASFSKMVSGGGYTSSSSLGAKRSRDE